MELYVLNVFPVTMINNILRKEPSMNIETCGAVNVRVNFNYRGDCRRGIFIEFNSGDFFISPVVIDDVLENFRGRRVMGGFSMTNPTPGGVGEYLKSLGNGLTPRHASFLCAVLRHEGLVRCSLQGNAVVVDFP
jgi:hypothetical protein